MRRRSILLLSIAIMMASCTGARTSDISKVTLAKTSCQRAMRCRVAMLSIERSGRIAFPTATSTAAYDRAWATAAIDSLPLHSADHVCAPLRGLGHSDLVVDVQFRQGALLSGCSFGAWASRAWEQARERVLAQRISAINAAIAANRIERVRLHAYGCFWRCARYVVTFDRNGLATYEQPHGTSRAQIAFSSVLAALRLADVAALDPSYPASRSDVDRFSLTLDTGGEQFTIDAADSPTWPANLKQLVAQLHGLVTHATWIADATR